MKEDILNVEFASLLYDFYGALLDEPRRQVVTLYHEDNLSLSEIAEELGTTRQNVHYSLKKAEAALEEYEKKLKLIEHYKINQKKVSEAIEILDKENINAEDKEKIKNILLEIIE